MFYLFILDYHIKWYIWLIKKGSFTNIVFLTTGSPVTELSSHPNKPDITVLCNQCQQFIDLRSLTSHRNFHQALEVCSQYGWKLQLCRIGVFDTDFIVLYFRTILQKVESATFFCAPLPGIKFWGHPPNRNLITAGGMVWDPALWSLLFNWCTCSHLHLSFNFTFLTVHYFIHQYRCRQWNIVGAPDQILWRNLCKEENNFLRGSKRKQIHSKTVKNSLLDFEMTTCINWFYFSITGRYRMIINLMQRSIWANFGHFRPVSIPEKMPAEIVHA